MATRATNLQEAHKSSVADLIGLEEALNRSLELIERDLLEREHDYTGKHVAGNVLKVRGSEMTSQQFYTLTRVLYCSKSTGLGWDGRFRKAWYFFSNGRCLSVYKDKFVVCRG